MSRPVKNTSFDIHNVAGEAKFKSEPGFYDASGTSPPALSRSAPDVLITTFPNLQAKSSEVVKGAWDQVLANLHLVAPQEYLTKDAMPLLSFAEYGETRSDQGSLRHNSNIVRFFGLVGDYDAGALTIDEATARLEKYGVLAAFYSTASSLPERPKWRVLLPLANPIAPSRYRSNLELAERIIDVKFDPASYTASQGFYYGRVAGTPYEFRTTRRRMLEPSLCRHDDISGARACPRRA